MFHMLAVVLGLGGKLLQSVVSTWQVGLVFCIVALGFHGR
uniref:Uncharacterized protein n=1 Tax=Anguilla anguilla TaxID=7936 RepID=A0A0E9TRT4_ANGAN